MLLELDDAAEVAAFHLLDSKNSLMVQLAEAVIGVLVVSVDSVRGLEIAPAASRPGV